MNNVHREDRSLLVNDIKVVEKLDIPVPDDGGIVVLRGGQGTGKSTALAAISKMLGGNVRGLESRDGAERGFVEFGGCRMTVSRSRTTRRGQLEVAELETRLDLAALVDPGIADGERADATRIKALVSLSGVQANVSAYHELVGGPEAFATLAVDTETTDPVVLAGRTKRALEAEARRRESIADTEFGKSAAARNAASDVDTKLPHDETQLRQQHTAAVEQLAKLTEKRRAFEQQHEAREKAKQSLDLAGQNYTGPTPDEAALEIEQTQAELNNAIALKEQAEQAYQSARQQLADAKAKHDAATASLRASEDHFRNLESWRETVKTIIADSPSDQQIEAARAEVDQAAAAIETGVKIRSAKQQLETALAHDHAARQARVAADALRGAAKATDDVLSSLIPSGPLRVEGGRLVVSTDRSQSELFSDLSDGERWRIAIDVAADQLPPHGLLVIPQVAYEGLTESTRQAINAHAKQRQVVIITAEAIDGELHATEFASEGPTTVPAI